MINALELTLFTPCTFRASSMASAAAKSGRAATVIASSPPPPVIVSEPVGLDFGAVMAMGGALGCDLTLLAEVLPFAEYAIVQGARDEAEDDEE